MAISCIQLCFLAFLATFALPSDCSHQVHPKALFVFGDSLFDPGNNNYINTTTFFQANYSPYGESFFKYSTGRFSNGRIVPDFIAEYATLPLIPPYLQTSKHQLAYYGMNFASAGAGALVETFAGFVTDLKTQLRYFKNVARQLRSKLGNKEATILLSNAVYLFSIGNNDYSFPFVTNSSVIKMSGPEEYVQLVIGNFTAVIKEIYKQGGRKFGFLNLGSLGCVPSVRFRTNGECAEEITALAKLHNVLLYKKIKNMEEKFQGFHYSIFDTFGTAAKMVENPSKFGFKEVESACCGSGPFRGINSCGGKRGRKEFELCDNVEEYLFFDSDHPTEAAYRQFAKLMWNGNENLTGPHNLKSLFQLTI